MFKKVNLEGVKKSISINRFTIWHLEKSNNTKPNLAVIDLNPKSTGRELGRILIGSLDLVDCELAIKEDQPEFNLDLGVLGIKDSTSDLSIQI